ncbi:Kelch repeat-containing protein [Pedobacter psychroterrae]|uniref:N-acetylneuraminic acid mutarotase n=1 Tax=Pedobacter psychroterrae TaxID=2530453 RepID=A0A4R0NPQ8_9SPHI|nr:hypothetical protein [Pedobacter psychroterrae]TCD01215.1 hypothetical protein EZ437_10670 [Pedobacter psychroterrae]
MSSTNDGQHFFVSGGHDYGPGTDLHIYQPKTQQWQIIPLSLQRSNTDVSYLKGKVFVAGGTTNSVDKFRIDIYDMATRTSSVKLFGDNQYVHRVFSAILEDRYLLLNDESYFYLYDSQTDRWETIDIPLSKRVTATDMVGVGTKVYLNDLHDYPALKVFDFKTREWTTLNAERQEAHIILMAVGDSIYFSGNRSFDALDHIDVLDTKTGLWSKIIHPGKRAFYEMAFEPKSKSLIVTGGRTAEIDAWGNPYLKMSDDLLTYNLQTKAWQQGKIKQIRHAHTTQVVGDQFIIFGGESIFNGYPATLPMEVYTLNYQQVAN